MAFPTKTDYAGLHAIAAALEVKTDSLGATNEVYSPMGENGDIAGIEVYGEDATPSNEYSVTGAVTLAAGAIQLNAVNSVANKKYGIAEISGTTGAGAAPTVSAASQLLESTATDAANSHYPVPAIAITTKQTAQDVLGSFAMSGERCELTKCNWSVKCTINPDKLQGEIKSTDCNSGLATVTGTVLSCNGITPTITPSTGWTLTKPPALSDATPEAAYKEFTFELQKTLVKVSPTAAT